MEMNLGALLTLETQTGASQYNFQNYKVNAKVDHGGLEYVFAPFSFSGAVASLDGDNIEAGLIFSSNKLTRAWADRALREGWIGKVKIMVLDDDSTIQSELYNYVGAISSGGWDPKRLELSLSTVMDAVRGSVPARRYTRPLVGKIPITAAVRV